MAAKVALQHAAGAGDASIHASAAAAAVAAAGEPVSCPEWVAGKLVLQSAAAAGEAGLGQHGFGCTEGSWGGCWTEPDALLDEVHWSLATCWSSPWADHGQQGGRCHWHQAV